MPEISLVAKPPPLQLQQQLHPASPLGGPPRYHRRPPSPNPPPTFPPPSPPPAVPFFQKGRNFGAFPPQRRVQGVRTRVGFVQEERKDGHVAGGQLGPHHLEKAMKRHHPIILQALFFLPRHPGNGGIR